MKHDRTFVIRPGMTQGTWETMEGQDVEPVVDPVVETEAQGELGL